MGDTLVWRGYRLLVSAALAGCTDENKSLDCSAFPFLASSCTFFLDEKSTKKIKAVCKSYDFAKISGGAKPNSPFLRQGSNRVLLLPPSISQNRDLQKADAGSRLATCFSAFLQRWVIVARLCPGLSFSTESVRTTGAFIHTSFLSI
jgi:hypothetical protein